MEYFDIRDPQANQILVWSDIEQAFINVDPSNTSSGVIGGLNLSNQGSTIFQDVSAGNMRFRNIVGGNSITLNDFNTYIEIEFDGDANTLNGLSSSEFILKEKNLSDIDSAIARVNLDVYSTVESHEQFMETNASNIPDLDNTYDLGSNGRRYAGIYARTFHGNATSASFANDLNRNNAQDGQVLTWVTESNKWLPKTPTPMSIYGAIDVFTDTLRDRSLLRYNANRNRWEPDNSESAGSNGSGGISDIENLGNGLGVYKDRTGFVANYRSLRAGDDISLSYNFNEEEIVISADVPQNTNDLDEGTTNLYYTDQRFDARFSLSSVRALSDVQGGTPSINQTLVWNGSSFTFRTVVVDVESTDDIPEGSSNLYYTDSRVESVIENFFQISGFTFDDLSDVSVSHNNGDVVISDGTNWVNSPLSISMLNDVDITGITTGDVLVWNNGVSGFLVDQLPTILFDLDETIDSEHFNDTSFNSKISSISSDDIIEGSSNIYLRNGTLVPLLNDISINEMLDVDLSNIINNSGLRWDSSVNSFVVYDTPQNLFDLDETIDSEHFNDTSFNSKISSITSDNIAEGSVNLYLNDVNFDSKFNNSSILSLSDVNGSGLNEGYVLSWSLTEEEFIAVSIESLSNDVSTLNDLTDVSYNIVDMNDGDILVWETSNSQFIQSTPISRVVQLNDVNTTNLIENDTLVFDGSNFINKQILPFELTTPSLNQLLLWDGSKFINSNLADAGAIVLRTGDLQDVIIDYDTVQTGDSLIWDESVSSFVLGPSAQYINIVDINGMDIENIQENDSIRWDGFSFVRTSLPIFNPQSFTDLSVLVYSTSDNAFISTDIWSLLNINNDDPEDGDVFVYNSLNGEYDSRGLQFDDISGLSDPIVTKQNNKDYVLRWSDITNEYQIYEPRIIVDVLTDLNDVSFTNIQAGDFVTWDEVNGVFTNTTISINNLNDVTITDLSENEVLYWNGSEFVNGNVPVSLLGLTDVNATNINDGQVLAWDLVAGEFINRNVQRRVTELDDVIFGVTDNIGSENDINQYSLLSWDISSNSFVSTLTTRKLQRSSYKYELWFEPYTEIDPITEEEITIESPIQYDFIDTERTFHTREVSDVTEFKLLTSEIEEGHFMYVHLVNNDNYDVSFSVGEMVEVTDPEPGLEYQGVPVEFLNQIDFNGETIVCFYTLDGLNWKGYEFIQPIGKSLPNISTSTVNNREIYVYNDSSVQFEPKRLDTYDLVDFPEVRVDQSALIWNELTNEFDFKQFSLTTLSDVNIDAITDGQYIIWDEINSEFVNHTPSIIELSDVATTDIQVNDILQWDGTQFINRDVFDLNELSDVNITNLTDMQILTWSEVSSEWINTTIEITVEELFNTNIVNPQENDVLTWDSANSEWVNRNVALSVDDLIDVNITDIVDGDILSWNMTNNSWENITLSISLEELSNTNIQTIQEGDILVWDSTNLEWINTQPLSSILALDDVSDILDNNLPLIWNGTEITTTSTIENVQLNSITYTLSNITTTTINPEDALYQSLTTTADMSYIIDDIVGLVGVYKFTIILDNTDNYLIDFSSATGIVEYVGGSSTLSNGKFLIEVLTINGTDWILDVSDPIS